MGGVKIAPWRKRSQNITQYESNSLNWAFVNINLLVESSGFRLETDGPLDKHK